MSAVKSLTAMARKCVKFTYTNSYQQQECNPVGYVPAARRPYAGVWSQGSAPRGGLLGGLLRGVSATGGCLLQGVSALGAVCSGGSAPGGLLGGVCSGGVSALAGEVSALGGSVPGQGLLQGVLLWGVSAPGGFLLQGGFLLPGGLLPGGGLPQTRPPPVNRITDTSNKVYRNKEIFIKTTKQLLE